MQAPEECRIRDRKMPGSLTAQGNNGLFVIRHPKIDGYFFTCIASDAEEWQHVSIVVGSKKLRVRRFPTWAEVCFIKDMFWPKEEVVVQYLPASADQIDERLFKIDLWRPVKHPLPSPFPAVTVTQ